MAILLIAFFSFALKDVRAEDSISVPDFISNPSGDGYFYDDSTNTLTINGVNWSGTITSPEEAEIPFVINANSRENYLNCNIVSNSGLRIEGDSKITISSNSTYTISVGGPLEITATDIVINNTSSLTSSSAIKLNGLSSELLVSTGHLVIESTNGSAIEDYGTGPNNITFGYGYVELTGKTNTIKNVFPTSSVNVSGAIVVLNGEIPLFNPLISVNNGILYSKGTIAFAQNGDTSISPGDGTISDTPEYECLMSFIEEYGFYYKTNNGFTKYNTDEMSISYSDVESLNIKEAIIAKGVYQDPTLDTLSLTSSYVFGDLTLTPKEEEDTYIETCFIEGSVKGTYYQGGNVVINGKLLLEDTIIVNPPTDLITEFQYDGDRHFIDFIEHEYYHVSSESTNSLTEPGEVEVKLVLEAMESEEITSHLLWGDTLDKADKVYTLKVTKIAIDKPTVDTTPITYDGFEHSLTIEENEHYTIVSNAYTGAGNHTVTVSLLDTDHYMWDDETTDDLEFELIISSKVITVPTVDTSPFTYDGLEHSLSIPTSEYYDILGNSETNAGVYTVTLSLTDKLNYVWDESGDIEDITFTLTINKIVIDIPSVETTAFTYDSTPKSLEIDESEYYTIFNNSATTLGPHTVTVSLNDSTNYEWDNGYSDDLEYELYIYPMRVDKPVVYQYEFIYDGFEHHLDIDESEYYTVYNNSLTEIGSVSVEVELISEYYEWSDGTSENLVFTLRVREEYTENNYIYYVYDDSILSDIINPNDETFQEEIYTFKPLSHPLIEFIGWYLDSGFKTLVTDTENLSGYNTLYGKFSYKPYELILDYNGITYKKKTEVNIGSFSPAETISIPLSDYVPTVSGYQFSGFTVGNKTYVFTLKTDSNILSNVKDGKVVLKALYSISDINENESVIGFYNTDDTPSSPLSLDGINYKIQNNTIANESSINSRREEIFNLAFGDSNYFSENELALKETSSYTLTLLKNDSIVTLNTISPKAKIIIPINETEGLFTKYVVIHESTSKMVVATRSDKFGNEDINGKYLSFMIDELGSFTIVGVKAFIYKEFMEEGMDFEYNDGYINESLKWLFKEYERDFYNTTIDRDYSVGKHYLIVTPKPGYYYRALEKDYDEPHEYTDGTNESLKINYSIKKHYTTIEFNNLKSLTLDDFEISYNRISLKREYIGKIEIETAEFTFGTATDTRYIYDTYISNLVEDETFNIKIKYVYLSTDTYFSSEEKELILEFKTPSFNEYIASIVENEKYPLSFRNLISNLPEDFPIDAIDIMIQAFDKLDSLKLESKDSKYFDKIDEYIEGIKENIVEFSKDKTDVTEISIYIGNITYDTDSIMKNINESVSNVEELVQNENIHKDLEEKYGNYIDSLMEDVLNNIDGLSEDELREKTEFISNTTETLSNLNNLYKDEVENAYKDEEKQYGTLLGGIYSTKVNELMSDEYLFNLDVHDFSRFYDYVDTSVKGVKSLINTIKNCDGANSKFVLNIETSIKVIEVSTFRDFNKEEMDELFYYQADEALYLHVQELMLKYLDAWFDDIKSSGKYSKTKLKEMEKEYLKQKEIVSSDETFKPIYLEAKKNVEEGMGENANLNTISTSIRSMNILDFFKTTSKKTFTTIDGVITAFASILVIGFIALLILKKKGGII